jgi:hypothetical protein
MNEHAGINYSPESFVILLIESNYDRIGYRNEKKITITGIYILYSTLLFISRDEQAFLTISSTVK